MESVQKNQRGIQNLEFDQAEYIHNFLFVEKKYHPKPKGLMCDEYIILFFFFSQLFFLLNKLPIFSKRIIMFEYLSTFLNGNSDLDDSTKQHGNYNFWFSKIISKSN